MINFVPRRFTDAAEAVTFIEKIQEKIKMNKEANVLTMLLIGKVKLHKYNELKKKKNIIRPVHSQFYLLCSDLYRIQGKHREFYASSAAHNRMI